MNSEGDVPRRSSSSTSRFAPKRASTSSSLRSSSSANKAEAYRDYRDYDVAERRHRYRDYNVEYDSTPSPASNAAVAASASAADAAAGLPLRSLPAKILSSESSARRRSARRAEYLETTRRRVVPKIAELAGRLVPAAAAELGGVAAGCGGEEGEWGRGRVRTAEAATPRQSRQQRQYSGLECTPGTDDKLPLRGGYKTTGLDDDDDETVDALNLVDELEGGGYHPRRDSAPSAPEPPAMSPMMSPLVLSPFPTSKGNSSNGKSGEGGAKRKLCLPSSAAFLAAGLEAPSSHDEDSPDGKGGSNASGHGGVVAVETIAASLESSVALLDYEADALIHSLRGHYDDEGDDDDEHNHQIDSEGAAAIERGRALAEDISPRGRQRCDSVDSLSAMSDDGMGGEIRRLNHVVDSLRKDLASASDLAYDDTEAGKGEGNGNKGEDREGRSRSVARRRSRRSGGSFRRTNSLAEQLQTWKYFGLRDDIPGQTGTSNTAALYWAVALVWAIVILLAGHVKLRTSFGEEGMGWEDVLGFLFDGGNP